MKANGIPSAAELARLINEVNGPKTVDKSYLSKLLKNGDVKTANMTIKKLLQICSAFDVELWQMFNPMGFGENGISLATSGTVDKKTLTAAVKYSVSAAEKLDIEDLNFISEVTTEAYVSIASGSTDDLGVTLAQLTKNYA